MHCQILETIPISEEVSELVQKLGNFYTEVDKEEEEKENESDKRPFTRPFTEHKGDADDQKYRIMLHAMKRSENVFQSLNINTFFLKLCFTHFLEELILKATMEGKSFLFALM